jgi:hypothetical protein
MGASIGRPDEPVPATLVEIFDDPVRRRGGVQSRDVMSLRRTPVGARGRVIVHIDFFPDDRWWSDSEVAPVEGPDVEEDLATLVILYEPVESGREILEDPHPLPNDL